MIIHTIALLMVVLSLHAMADSHNKHIPNGSVINVPTSINGRLLASNCFQCHNTMGINGFDQLQGKSQIKIFTELMEKRIKHNPKIMTAHALSYNKQQLWDISNYLSKVDINTTNRE